LPLLAAARLALVRLEAPARLRGAGFFFAGFGAVFAPVAFVRAVLVAAGVARPVLAVAGVDAAGVAGADGGVVVAGSRRPPRNRPATPVAAEVAARPIPTAESMMLFGLMAMPTVLPEQRAGYTAMASAVRPPR
jgi:hypothetical protein